MGLVDIVCVSGIVIVIAVLVHELIKPDDSETYVECAPKPKKRQIPDMVSFLDIRATVQQHLVNDRSAANDAAKCLYDNGLITDHQFQWLYSANCLNRMYNVPLVVDDECRVFAFEKLDSATVRIHLHRSLCDRLDPEAIRKLCDLSVAMTPYADMSSAMPHIDVSSQTERVLSAMDYFHAGLDRTLPIPYVGSRVHYIRHVGVGSIVDALLA